MGGVRIFKPGDHVRHKDCVHEEGIVLARSEDPDEKNYYFAKQDRSQDPSRSSGQQKTNFDAT